MLNAILKLDRWPALFAKACEGRDVPIVLPAAMLIISVRPSSALPSDGGLLLFQTMEAFTAKCQYRLILNISRGIKGSTASDTHGGLVINQ